MKILTLKAYFLRWGFLLGGVSVISAFETHAIGGALDDDPELAAAIAASLESASQEEARRAAAAEEERHMREAIAASLPPQGLAAAAEEPEPEPVVSQTAAAIIAADAAERAAEVVAQLERFLGGAKALIEKKFPNGGSMLTPLEFAAYSNFTSSFWELKNLEAQIKGLDKKAQEAATQLREGVLSPERVKELLEDASQAAAEAELVAENIKTKETVFSDFIRVLKDSNAYERSLG
ncbi:MAG: hypothetical protein ACRC12_02540 [Holosporales bacterium]